MERIAVGHIKREQRCKEIAQGDALQHGPDAQMSKVPRIAPQRHVEPMDGQTNDEEQHRAPDHLYKNGAGGGEATLEERQIARDTHDEKEEREDQIAGRHAIPLRMA